MKIKAQCFQKLHGGESKDPAQMTASNSNPVHLFPAVIEAVRGKKKLTIL